MWQEVYYETGKGNYRETEEKILPYSVKCRSGQTKSALENLLRRDGFRCVGGSDCLGLLVNLKLMRFCSYPKPAAMSCIRSYSYSVESFLSGVYLPWYTNKRYGTKPEDMRLFRSMRYRSFIQYYRNVGLTDEEILEKLACFA